MADIPAIVEAEVNLETTYDASDAEQVQKMRKKSGQTRRARLDFVKAMLELPEGRKYLWDLMGKCFIYGNPIVQGDPPATYFNLGQQNIGKLLLQDVQEFPDLYVLMVAELRPTR